MISLIMEKRFAIHTLGCKVNTYESDAIAGLMKQAGYVQCDFEEQADVYIINTCTVTNIADRKSRQMLHRARKLNPSAVVVAAGCYVDAARRNPETAVLLKDEAVDIFISNNEKSSIAAMIDDFRTKRDGAAEYGNAGENSGYVSAGAEPVDWDVKIPEAGKNAADNATNAAGSVVNAAGPEKDSGKDHRNDLFITELSGHTRAFLKIQDGCNQFCSYCIIPFARGRILSRPAEDIIREVTRLADSGIKEIVLTGIHLSSYGKDVQAAGRSGKDAAFTVSADSGKINERIEARSDERTVRLSDDIMNGGMAPLLEVIEAVNAVPGISRIRLGSLEPRLMSDGFVKRLSSCEKVCPHFHLSLQSGSDTVLKRMNRHYTAEEYAESAKTLRRYFDHPAITTDIIVGFPGETEEEFEETLAFAKRVGFYEAHVFKYSRRSGTVADRMDGQITEAVKNARSKRLIALADELSHVYRASFLGKQLEFLAEEEAEYDGVRYVTGYTEEYVRVLKQEKEFMANTMLKGRAVRLVTVKDLGECMLLA